MSKNYKEIGYFFGFIGKNSLLLFLINILSAFSSFIVGVLASRRLGVVFFGEYVTAYNLYSLFYVFPLLGLGIFVIRELAKDKANADKYFINVGFINLIASGACFLLICAIVSLLKYPTSTKTATYIVGLSLFPSSLTLLIQALFIALAKVRYAFLAAILEVLAKVILSVLVLTLGYRINALMAIHVLSKFINLALSVYFILRNIGNFRLKIDLGFCRQVLKEAGFAFALITLLGNILTKIDIVVLSSIRPIMEVGWYGPASKFVLLGYMFVVSITTTFFPLASKFFVVSPELFAASSRQLLKYLTIILLPLLLIGFLASEQLILFCFGKEFASSVIAFKIVIWSIFFVGVSSLCDYILISGNKQRLVIYAMCFSLAVSLGLNIFFSNRWGYIGTGVAVLLSMGIFVALECLFVNRFMFKLRLVSILGKPLLSAAIAGIFVLLVQGRTNLWSLILLSVSIYFLTLFILKTFTEEDIKFLRNFQKEYLASA